MGKRIPESRRDQLNKPKRDAWLDEREKKGSQRFQHATPLMIKAIIFRPFLSQTSRLMNITAGMKWSVVLALLCFSSFTLPQKKIYSGNNGAVSFISDAPLEVIKAQSGELKSAIDTEDRSFLFTVSVNSFHGFNSGLQREHFNENYLETVKYPKASFVGKFIEDINFSRDGTYDVRAKGILDVHGVKQERIIKGIMRVNGSEIRIESDFSVALEDHNIKIPRVVYQKISPQIDVTMIATLELLQ